MSNQRTFTFLGTGTSVGVPMIGCDCPTCHSADPRNQRYRCSALVTAPAGRILIDTPPELRLQLLRAKVPFVHAVLLTHYHADHLFGLDDVRLFPKRLGGPLPLYCTADVESTVRQAFAYAFAPGTDGLPPGILPQLRFVRIENGKAFTVLGQRIRPIRLEHATFEVQGFRIDDLAYCTDVSSIPDQSWPMLEGLRVLILDALRLKPHPAHFSLAEALDVIARLRPAKAYLTHMCHDLEHEATQRTLPSNVEMAYDGLSFEF
jgi:phosphoribosyl 1,2-cyclic phosphate phosphodiesterase